MPAAELGMSMDGILAEIPIPPEKLLVDPQQIALFLGQGDTSPHPRMHEEEVAADEARAKSAEELHRGQFLNQVCPLSRFSVKRKVSVKDVSVCKPPNCRNLAGRREPGGRLVKRLVVTLQEEGLMLSTAFDQELDSAI
jgi:hypothetical protein